MTAVYSTAGAQQASTHIVTGSVTTNGGGNATVSLAGSAVFASGTSYVCTATAQANSASAVSVRNMTATGFDLRGAGTTLYGFVCVGT